MKFNLSTEDFFKGYLARPAGIPEERFRAFELPSVVNGKKIPATGIKAGLVGGPRAHSQLEHTHSGPIKN
jgi:hypothetical protein